MKSFKVDIINLEHRADRKVQSIEAMKKIKDLTITGNNFFKAISLPENGMLGCAISHFSILAEFVKQTKYDYQIVFEDDIEFRHEFELSSIFNVIDQYIPTLDVFLFAHNTAIFTDTIYEKYQRVINVQTASGYIVTRKFAPSLLMCFGRAINFMSKFANPEQRPIVNSLFAHDQLWKQLQLDHLFITTNPSLGYQRASYSDIEKKEVNYGV